MQIELERRKQKLVSFIKSYIYYILTAIAIFTGAFIRTRNLPLLKDKLLLALDPYVFYRYTKYIVEHGSLMAWDTMRYVPLGYDPSGTGSLLSYIIAYSYKFIHIFIPSLTLEKFNILYPVIVFILAMIVRNCVSVFTSVIALTLVPMIACLSLPLKWSFCTAFTTLLVLAYLFW